MWQFFTERSKHVIQIAHREALRLGHPRIGTEHLMIGLIAEESSVAALALKDAGLVPEDVLHKILALRPPQQPYMQAVDLPAELSCPFDDQLREIHGIIIAFFVPSRKRRH